MPSLKVSSILIAKWKVMYMIEEKNMCDKDDSKEILEYTGGSELSDLTFQTGYENYSQWRIKEILKEVGFRLEPLYVGYKALLNTVRVRGIG